MLKAITKGNLLLPEEQRKQMVERKEPQRRLLELMNQVVDAFLTVLGALEPAALARVVSHCAPSLTCGACRAQGRGQDDAGENGVLLYRRGAPFAAARFSVRGRG